jgi:uncharacterized membrane protein YoaT (DUF817 family)
MENEKLITLIIAGVYILPLALTGHWELGWRVLTFLIFPLACIWFAEDIGNYTGNLTMPPVTQRTPAIFIKIGGWVLLLLPVICGVIIILMR